MEKKVKDKKNKKSISCCGSKIKKPIEYYYDNDAKCMCPRIGKPLDRYAMVQAAKAKVDINDIIKRAQCGDVSVLNMKHEIDVSKSLPKIFLISGLKLAQAFKALIFN